MRVFIAVEFSEELKGYLTEIKEKVKGKSIKGNFTSADNFHLTVRFIGEVDAVRLQFIREAIDRVAMKVEKFQLELSDLGNFPRKNKRIVWIGVKGEMDSLNRLYKTVEEELERKGFQREEREYTPHITLGREVILQDSFQNLKETVEIKKYPIMVSQISLMESTRENGKLVYKSRIVKELG